MKKAVHMEESSRDEVIHEVLYRKSSETHNCIRLLADPATPAPQVHKSERHPACSSLTFSRCPLCPTSVSSVLSLFFLVSAHRALVASHPIAAQPPPPPNHPYPRPLPPP